NNPISCHHPSHLILQIDNPPLLHPLESSLMKRHAVEVINAMINSEIDIRIISVKWNNKGNCIVITNPQYTADNILPFHHLFRPTLMNYSPYKALPDKEWHRILLNGVDTGKSDIDDKME
ncbi:hypothetical protein V8B97DRAFT_1842648, partial [Scleroderma yunnanense]